MGASSAQASERRRHRRVPISVIIDYETADQFFRDYALNLSLGGIYVRTSEVFPVGSRLKIHFSFPEYDDFIDGWATVVRVDDEEGEEGVPGMAIQFDELDANAKSIIDDVVRASLS